MLFVKCCVCILALHASALFSGTISLLDSTSEIKKKLACALRCATKRTQCQPLTLDTVPQHLFYLNTKLL